MGGPSPTPAAGPQNVHLWGRFPDGGARNLQPFGRGAGPMWSVHCIAALHKCLGLLQCSWCGCARCAPPVLLAQYERAITAGKCTLPRHWGCIGTGGGGVRGGGEGALAGPPLLPASPYGPRRRRAENFEASILLALKAPEQSLGCQPQTLEGEEGGGGARGGEVPPPSSSPSSCGARPF